MVVQLRVPLPLQLVLRHPGQQPVRRWMAQESGQVVDYVAFGDHVVLALLDLLEFPCADVLSEPVCTDHRCISSRPVHRERHQPVPRVYVVFCWVVCDDHPDQNDLS